MAIFRKNHMLTASVNFALDGSGWPVNQETSLFAKLYKASKCAHLLNSPGGGGGRDKRKLQTGALHWYIIGCGFHTLLPSSWWTKSSIFSVTEKINGKDFMSNQNPLSFNHVMPGFPTSQVIIKLVSVTYWKRYLIASWLSILFHSLQALITYLPLINHWQTPHVSFRR